MSHGVSYGAVVKGYLFVQEITMKKRFINRIDLYMAKLPKTYPNENVFLLLDDQHRILYTRRFSSTDFGEALYFPFDFKRNFDIGKGETIFACIYSLDGDRGSYIGLAKKENSNLGKLYVVSIVNDDIVQSFEQRQSLVSFPGSIGARTFETDSRFFSLLQLLGYLLAIFLSLLLFFGRQTALFIRQRRVAPQHAFLVFSGLFGMIMLVITPPFMSPDEPAHFYRSYQISEFNIFKVKDDFPKSLLELSAICDRMQFSTHEKTTPSEILSLGNIRANPAERTSKVTPDYLLPYLPQAIGIAVGKIFGLAPLWLFYLGRLFNLMATIALIFLAIRITPVFKWGFFLLGVMPMTLYQAASLSYDAVTIGFSFLLLATFIAYAFREGEKISTRDVVRLFIITALLAASKQPYCILVLVFLIIPVEKFGSLKRYLAIFAELLITVALFSQLYAPGRAIAQKLGFTKTNANAVTIAAVSKTFAGEEPVRRKFQADMLPLLPHSPETMNAAQEQAAQQPAAVKTGQQPQPNDASQVNAQLPVDPINPVSQKNFILNNPLAYTGILFNTLGKSLDLYLTSFVGLFGWIDTPLPPAVAYTYLLFLLLFSLLDPIRPKGFALIQKCIMSGVFIVGFVLIETALYIYFNPVSCDPVTAVQGRYFIAIGPLIFLLFTGDNLFGILQRAFSPSPKIAAGKKSREKQPVLSAGLNEMLLPKAMPWIAMMAALATLACSVFVILERFYVISTG